MDNIQKQLEMLNQQVKEISGLYHHAANQCGTSDTELWVWYALLILKGEYTQQNICDMWALPKQTVNTVISNLMKKGFLFLETIPGTRNKKIIRISEEGRRYGEGIVTKIFGAEKNAFTKMTELERQMCVALLSKYFDFLKEGFYENGII